MSTIPCTMTAVTGVFAPLFSKRVFEHANLLLMGTILASERRTVTTMLRVMGKSSYLRPASDTSGSPLWSR
jgi:hypothetical protein